MYGTKPDCPDAGPDPGRGRSRIVLFSPDVDFCVSMRLCFQDRYTITTTTDLEMLSMIVHDQRPDLLIADALPTMRIRRRFDAMKRCHARLAIVLMCGSRFLDEETRSYLRKSVITTLYKPVDLAEIGRRIEEYMGSPPLPAGAAQPV